MRFAYFLGRPKFAYFMGIRPADRAPMPLCAGNLLPLAAELPVPLLGVGVPKTHLAGTRMKVNIYPNIVSTAALALTDTMYRELKETGETSRPQLSAELLTRITGSTHFSELAKRWLSTP